MTQRWGGWYWHLELASLLAIGGALAASSIDCTLAQITSDGTLEAETVVTPTNINGLPTEQIDGGVTREANLFHSFEQFSVPTGSAAYFNNALDIQNIISRVTGGSVSNINGLLSARGTANLFLLNPNGIIFGPNASLNIGGSFLASTASSLNFADGTQFSTAPQITPLLTVSVPLGLQLGGNAEGVFVQGSSLSVRVNKTLALMGGDVRLDGSILRVPGGRVELGGLADSGTAGLSVDGNNLRLSYPEGLQRADVSLTNGTQVNVRDSSGGSIAISARSLNMAGGSGLQAGIASGLGSVDSFAGDIEINATEAINLTNSSTIENSVSEAAVGNSGGINIKTGLLSATNGSFLSTSTFGQGNAGSVNIHAGSTVSFDGVHNGIPGGVPSLVAREAVGNSGGINIKTGSLSVTNGAALSTTTFGRGDAGSVKIHAGSTVSFDGVSSDGFRSSAFSAVEAGAVGNAGDINIKTGSLSVTNGALLSARTRGKGNGGNITLNANTLKVVNGGQVFNTSLSSGNAGDITLNVTDSVTLAGSNPTNNAQLAQQDEEVDINTGSASGLFANTASGSGGQGGRLVIATGRLNVQDGAEVNVSSDGAGAAGDLTVSADSISLDNQSSILATTAAGNQGTTTLRASTLILRNFSKITTNATGTATGGNITLNTDILAVLGNSDITANALEGRGGNVQINTQGLFLSPNSQITASSQRGIDGVVEINTSYVDPSQGLATLPVELVDLSGLIATGCAAVEENKFVITGRGGLPDSPSDTLSSDAVQVDLVTLNPEVENHSSPAVSTNPIALEPAPLVEAQGWMINDLGEVVLTATAPNVTTNTPWITPANCHAFSGRSEK